MARLGLASCIAVCAFVALAILALAILWPWTWEFAAGARVLIEDHLNADEPRSAGALQLFLARIMEVSWESNQAKLDRLFWCFRIASVCLTSEVIAWVIALGTG